MTNVEDRINKYNKRICPDCGTKLKTTEYDDGQKPIVYCEKCLLSFELYGGQVMSEGDLKQRINEKWRLYREATGDGMHEISVGMQEKISNCTDIPKELIYGNILGSFTDKDLPPFHDKTIDIVNKLALAAADYLAKNIVDVF